MQGFLSLVETLVRDLRYAVRTLRRDAALTTFAILIIGVGIGASTTVFGVVDALWLRPLPFDDPERLVWVANGPSENLSRQAVQVGHFVDLREQSQSLAGLAGFSPFYGAGLQHVRSVPGVEAVGLTDALPLGDNFGWRGWTVSARDRATDPGARANPLVRMIDDRYFSAMRIAMKAGRGFTSDDHPSSERVVVINEALGRALWPNDDPLGQVLRASGRDYRVVGVVNDVRYFALERDTGQEMYMLLRQTGDYQTVDLVVRSAVPPASLIPGIRTALKHADPDLPAVEFRTMEQLVDRSVFTRRIAEVVESNLLPPKVSRRDTSEAQWTVRVTLA